MNVAVQNLATDVDFRSSLTADSASPPRTSNRRCCAWHARPCAAGGRRPKRTRRNRGTLANGKGAVPAPPFGEIYDTVTDDRGKTLRVCELLYAVAERFPGLVPTRARIEGERISSCRARRKAWRSIRLVHRPYLGHPERGLHLVHAMLKPKREALEKFAEFQKTGAADLGEARVERDGNVGHVTLTNPAFLNAEGDRTSAI